MQEKKPGKKVQQWSKVHEKSKEHFTIISKLRETTLARIHSNRRI